jgi:cytochrome c biogenesis protein CcmG, thiol:disulfide interchange protein DsbE
MPNGKHDRIFLGILLLSVCALAFAVADSLRDRVIRAGDQAPAFSVRADNGLTVTPTQFGGKVLIVNFWATWCPPCVQETPSLVAFANQYRDKGVVVLGVSVDKSQKNYDNFLRRHSISFLTTRDPEAKVSDSFGTYVYPESYVINREGKVVQKIIGATNWADPNLARFIEGML